MARYVTRIATPLAPAEAFAFVADMRRFAEWDPGVRAAVQVAGDGPGPEAAYELTLARGGAAMRYEVRAFESPRRLLLESRTALLHSLDEIRVEADPDGAGALVTYDARLTLRGPLGLFDIALRPMFRRIGDAAAAGLRRALRGVEA
jgi:hypothetical protein